MITIGVCILVHRQQQKHPKKTKKNKTKQEKNKKKKKRKKDVLTKYSDLNIVLLLANQITCPNKSTRV